MNKNMATTSMMTTTRSSSSTTVRNRKKKKTSGIQSQGQNGNNSQNGVVSWKSEAQQQVYSSKLLQALRQVRLGSASKRGRAVREAADQALAVAAKGRTRWSRAILTNRLKLKFMKKNHHSSKRMIQRAVTGNSRLQKRSRVGILRLKTKNASSVQRKVKVLSRLVPGCRKQPLPVVLEEAGDYIAALEMQVRAMSTLAQLLSGAASSSNNNNNNSNNNNSQLGSSSRPPPS